MQVFLMCLFAVMPVAAQDAATAGGSVGFRTDGTGVYLDANPPVKWSATENVIWKTPMPSSANAMPILVGDRIFVTNDKPPTLLCVSVSDGKILWSDRISYMDAVPEEELEAAELAARLKSARNDGESAQIRKQMKAVEYFTEPDFMTGHGLSMGYGGPTPCSDGKNVYVLYGNGMAASYDLKGNRRWVRFIEKPPNPQGYYSSPLLAGGVLLVHLGKVRGLDPATGKTRWQTDSPVTWATPVHLRVGETDVAVTAMGHVIRLSDGKKVATIPSGGGAEQFQPTVADNTVFLITGTESGSSATRLKPARDGRIEIETVWSNKELKGGPYSVYAEGLLYAQGGGDSLQVLDAKTGGIIYTQKLDMGECYQCITVAGPYVYFPVNQDNNKQSQMKVMARGRKYQVVTANIQMGENFLGAPVFSGTRMYIRGYKNLYCIGK